MLHGDLDRCGLPARLAAGRRAPPSSAHRLRLEGPRGTAAGRRPAGGLPLRCSRTGAGCPRPSRRASWRRSCRLIARGLRSGRAPLMRLALFRIADRRLPVRLEPPPPAARWLVDAAGAEGGLRCYARLRARRRTVQLPRRAPLPRLYRLAAAAGSGRGRGVLARDAGTASARQPRSASTARPAPDGAAGYAEQADPAARPVDRGRCRRWRASSG